jgi:hypothetical protein
LAKRPKLPPIHLPSIAGGVEQIMNINLESQPESDSGRAVVAAFDKVLTRGFRGPRSAVRSGGRPPAQRPTPDAEPAARSKIRDLQVAGSAAARKATLATRNVQHFEGFGLVVVDPADYALDAARVGTASRIRSR